MTEHENKNTEEKTTPVDKIDKKNPKEQTVAKEMDQSLEPSDDEDFFDNMPI